MKHWIPFFQSLVWPVAIGILLYCFRKQVDKLIAVILSRIERGDPFEAGGFKLGSPTEATKDAPGEIKAELEKNKPHSIYLNHRSSRAPDQDKDEKRYYRMRFWIDADDPGLLDGIKNVTYYLHPTFKQPVREISDRQTLFGLNTLGWGEFNLRAEVAMKDGKKFTLERYITIT